MQRESDDKARKELLHLKLRPKIYILLQIQTIWSLSTTRCHPQPCKTQFAYATASFFLKIRLTEEIHKWEIFVASQAHCECTTGAEECEVDGDGGKEFVWKLFPDVDFEFSCILNEFHDDIMCRGVKCFCNFMLSKSV